MLLNEPGSGLAHPGRLADRASLRALLNAALREWPGGRIVVRGGEIGTRVPMPASGLPPEPGAVLNDRSGQRPLDDGTALALILEALAERHGPTGATLARRIRASHARMRALIADRLSRTDEPVDFLAAEQAMIFGHWMHPCPKALDGMTLAEERQMTPDWRGRVQLVALSVEAGLIEATEPDLARDLPGFDRDLGRGRALLPVHPLAWSRARRNPPIAQLVATGRVRELGLAGPLWWATSSVRTLWSPDSAWQVKPSLPVTITNSRRVNLRHEMLAGAAMADWTRRLDGRFGPLRLLPDPHWMDLRLPCGSPSGLELILRENPWRTSRGGSVLQVGGLVAEPLPGHRSLLARVIGAGDPAAWFTAYLDCAVAPLLRLYDSTGISVEAHQQNALLGLQRGMPVCCWLRDGQGFYIAEDVAPAHLRAIQQLTYPRAEAEAALGYTLIVNQVFAVIGRLDADGLLAERRGLLMLADHLVALARLPGAGGALARRWLTSPTLPMKANLLTQLGGVDELALPGERAPFVQIPNPLPALARPRVLHVA